MEKWVCEGRGGEGREEWVCEGRGGRSGCVRGGEGREEWVCEGRGGVTQLTAHTQHRMT